MAFEGGSRSFGTCDASILVECKAISVDYATYCLCNMSSMCCGCGMQQVQLAVTTSPIWHQRFHAMQLTIALDMQHLAHQVA